MKCIRGYMSQRHFRRTCDVHQTVQNVHGSVDFLPTFPGSHGTLYTCHITPLYDILQRDEFSRRLTLATQIPHWREALHATASRTIRGHGHSHHTRRNNTSPIRHILLPPSCGNTVLQTSTNCITKFCVSSRFHDQTCYPYFSSVNKYYAKDVE